MTEHKVEIPGADGLAEGYVYTPSQGTGPWPGVVFLTDVFGVRDANKVMAKRVAEQGYVVALPNIFYRTDKLPITGFDKSGGEKSKRDQLVESLNATQMRDDGKAYVQYLLLRTDVKKGRLGVVGYCFTGKMALRTAAHVPDLIGAAASFHGGHLFTDKPDSPHIEIPKVKGELYFGHAQNDKSMTLENIQHLENALKQWAGKWQSEIYDGAQHGWTVPGRPIYNHDKAELAFTKLIDLFQRNLS